MFPEQTILTAQSRGGGGPAGGASFVPYTSSMGRGTTAQVGSYTGPSGELVLNTDDWSLQAQDGVTAGGWLLRPRLNARVVTGTGAQSVNVTDDLVVWAPTAPAAVTFTLPSSPRIGEAHGFKYLVATGQVFAMTIAPPGGQTIDGAGSYLLQQPNAYAECVYVGTNQWIVK